MMMRRRTGNPLGDEPAHGPVFVPWRRDLGHTLRSDDDVGQGEDIVGNAPNSPRRTAGATWPSQRWPVGTIS